MTTQRTNGKTLVTWSQLLTSLGILIGAFASTMAFVFGQHAEHPHVGSVTHYEMKQIERRLDASLTIINRQLDYIRNKLDSK